MSKCVVHGQYNGPSCPFCAPQGQILRVVKLPEYMEGAIGAALTAYNLPAAFRVRLLGTVAPSSAHSSILERGLVPKSKIVSPPTGLTPKIAEFVKDAARRVYLGGFVSSTVYSNMQMQSTLNPDWAKLVKNSRFQYAFLFVPSFKIMRTPLVAIVPENLYIKNFLKDDFSIVKVFAKRYFGFQNKVQIPGAVKSVEGFELAPKYFVASTHFSPTTIMSEAMRGQALNPIRFLRGLTFAGIGPVLIYREYLRRTEETE